MSKSYVVGIDSSEGSIRAAQFAVAHAAKAGASVKLIHVLEWSPYEFLTPEELSTRHKRRAEELHRANDFLVAPMVSKIANDKVSVEGETRYGQIADTISKYCDEIGADQVFVGRHGGGGISSRLFGSVPGVLVQMANVPITVVP